MCVGNIIEKAIISGNEDFLNLIREFNKAGKIIASICVGALPLAKSGVLCGRSATTYNFPSSIRQRQLKELGVNVIYDKSIVIDRNIITSYNPSTAFGVTDFQGKL